MLFRSYAVGGVYRRLLVRPSNVAGTICYYKDSNKPLVQSDIDKLREVNVKDNLMTGVCVCVCVVIVQGCPPRCCSSM